MVLISNLALLIMIFITTSTQQLEGARTATSTLLSAPNSASEVLQEGIKTANSEVYGVRWMLGDAFSSSPPRTNNNYYVLMFNSNFLFRGTVQLQLPTSLVACSSSSLQAENLNTTIYECIVTSDLGNADTKQMEYSIAREWMEVQGNDSWTKMEYKRQVLFEGVFRGGWQGRQLSVIFIGNWLVNDHEWMGALEAQINSKGTSLLLSTGDFFPEMTEQTYIDILTKLEPITSSLPLLITNSKHPSRFYSKLLISTFHSPLHQHYLSFLSFLYLPHSNVVVVMLDPIELNPQKNKLKFQGELDLPNQFQRQMNKVKKQWLEKQMFAIIITPYSYICSQQPQCSAVNTSLKDYQGIFNNIQRGLYLSASSYGYERSKPICPNRTAIQTNNNTYEMECIVYVNEGLPILGPINEDNPPKNNLSQYRSYQTGFGLINLQTNSTQFLIKMAYTHIDPHSVNRTSDSFIMQLPQAVPVDPQVFRRRVLYVVAMIDYGFILLVGVCVGWSFYTSLRNKRKRRAQNEVEGHVQMVQEGNNNPPQALRNPINA